ncbi:uncharacterized protein LOC125159345 isoform X2 [Prionailurus viverrinus]|uniref:uncharacterized protein LOC125159345 isoform X2 n=1 Tax=Prionailurus viverrinus TaxID=61388 RepID=UPI001FF11BDA|nr:uncharacterized protein LOC125159345 isoform X2 [Prionailurus viverrinus]
MRGESALDSNPGSATWTVTCRKMETPVPNLQPSSMVTKRSGGQGRQMENRCGSFLHLSAHGLPQGPPSVHPLFSSLPSWLKCIGLLLGAPTASHGSQMDEQMTGWTQNPRGLTHGRCLANAAPPLAPWRGGTRRAGHCYSSPGCSPDGKQKCPGVPWQSGQIPRGARWDRHGAQPPSRCDAHAPCPPPAAPGSHAAAAAAAPAPPAPRPLPARLPALLLALDRGGRTASQNAPPESGAQGPGGVVCVCWEFFCKDPDLRGKGVSSGASGDGWKVGVQGSCPHGKKGMRKRKPRLTGGGQDSLSGGPPPRCRYRLKTCPCTSSRQDGSFWTSVKGSSLQESVAGELPPFGVTGPRNNTVILLAPITTYLGLRVPTWPPCIQSPCIQSPWRCPCCCSTS